MGQELFAINQVKGERNKLCLIKDDDDIIEFETNFILTLCKSPFAGSKNTSRHFGYVKEIINYIYSASLFLFYCYFDARGGNLSS